MPSFTCQSEPGAARRGVLTTSHGEIQTPVFMPVATKASLKVLTPEDLRRLDFDVILGNTYHLYLRPGHNIIAQAGGLHSFMRWDCSILTDSGGYQVFSLGARKERTKNGKSLVKLTEEGAEFSSHIDGSRHMITPEKSIAIQQSLGSDIIMNFDECPPHDASREYQISSMERTTRWAKRCLEEHSTRAVHDIPLINPDALLFGIVQGGLHEDLRRRHAGELVELGFDGYAIGGLAVGESAEEMYRVLDAVIPELPADKPRYLMGVGRPDNIVEAVKRGVDMFDCVLPTRNARHGSVFVGGEVASDLSGVDYETVHIRNEQYAKDFTVLDATCNCETCASGFTKAYLRHLFSVGEPLALRLATIHNLAFMKRLIENIKSHI